MIVLPARVYSQISPTVLRVMMEITQRNLMYALVASALVAAQVLFVHQVNARKAAFVIVLPALVYSQISPTVLRVMMEITQRNLMYALMASVRVAAQVLFVHQVNARKAAFVIVLPARVYSRISSMILTVMIATTLRRTMHALRASVRVAAQVLFVHQVNARKAAFVIVLSARVYSRMLMMILTVMMATPLRRTMYALTASVPVAVLVFLACRTNARWKAQAFATALPVYVNLLMLPMVQCVMMAMAMLRRRTMYASAESVLAAASVLFVGHRTNARQQLFAIALVVVVPLRISLWVLIVTTATPTRWMTNVMATAFVQERMHRKLRALPRRCRTRVDATDGRTRPTIASPVPLEAA